MTYGLTSDGFVDKPLEVILAEIEQEQKTLLGDDLDVSPGQPLGQVNGVISLKLRELWEVLQAVNSAFDPDQSSGTSLTKLSSLTGTIRQAATKSTVTMTLSVNTGITVPAGSVIAVDGNPSARFVTLTDAPTGASSPDNVSVEAQAETAGPVVGNSGTVTQIETPLTGWLSATNASDATLGLEEETDYELRLSRENGLQLSGAAALEAIRADILEVDGVTACSIFVNKTNVTNSDGIPAHAIECVVSGGTDADVAAQLFATVGAGIDTYGVVSETVTDNQGEDHTINFNRPTVKTVHIIVECNINDDDYPADGDTQIKDNIAAWAQANLSGGDDVVSSQMYPHVIGDDGVSGVVDVTAIKIGFSDPPSTTTTLTIEPREVADIDTSNIDVSTTSV